MPGASALARAIAKAIAKGQVKKAARLEADALERRTLWLAFEEKAISQFNPHYVSPITAENMASARGFPPSTKLLMARGYSQARAEKLSTRIHMKAAREMSTALRENAAQPLPSIPDQDAVTKAVFEATSPDFLSLAELPDIKISSILSKNSRLQSVGHLLYMKTKCTNLLLTVGHNKKYT